MSSRPFMYVDLIRTAQITGGDALDDVVGGIGHNLTDKSGSDDGAKLLFCLDGMMPSSTTTSTTAGKGNNIFTTLRDNPMNFLFCIVNRSNVKYNSNCANNNHHNYCRYSCVYNCKRGPPQEGESCR